MKEKKMGLLIGILVAIVVTIGGTYAYFTSNVLGSGNESKNTTHVTMVSLGEIKYEGELTFQGTGLYPGYQNVQTFVIGPDRKEGTGIYEIDLEAHVPEVFGEDIEVTLYKTTTPTKDFLQRVEGKILKEGEQFSQKDEIVIKGAPEKVYGPASIQESSQIVLEQKEFEVPGMEETTYYLVYHYKNNGNQNAQQGAEFRGTITVRYVAQVSASSYQEELLNGTDPVVTGSLIPVTIEPDGTVKKADIRNKWYRYEEKQWANAVILEDESITYQNGEVIPESNIESYFVWIPRYKYQIFNEGNYPELTSVENKVQTIQVVFENKDTPVSNGTTVGNWLTHPAFTSFNSNGMWVGKFETGKKSGSDNVRNGEQVQIKPNVSSWRSIQVGNAFYTTYDYKRELDSHMMKNTEWGAVAYLQHSVYGSQASVRINNNSSYITGYSANQEPTCGYTGTNESCNLACNDGSCNQPYNTSIGYLASTTGNISGIYDMSGGAWEYVMGVMLDTSGKAMSGLNASLNSGFKGSYSEGGTNVNGLEWPALKYYETYSFSNSNALFSRRILGDATGEMGPFATSSGSWYKDGAWFIPSGAPWFIRGADFPNGTTAGIFSFSNARGNIYENVSFRTVLIP